MRRLHNNEQLLLSSIPTTYNSQNYSLSNQIDPINDLFPTDLLKQMQVELQAILLEKKMSNPINNKFISLNNILPKEIDQEFTFSTNENISAAINQEFYKEFVSSENMFSEAIKKIDQIHKKKRNRNRKRKHKKKIEKICVECQTKETPEWRSGPNGYATLCNACGLRAAKRKKIEKSRN